MTIRCCIQMFGQPVQRHCLDQISRQSKKGEDHSECFRFAVAFFACDRIRCLFVYSVYILFIYDIYINNIYT